jgi:ATP-binding cassette subfamily B protein
MKEKEENKENKEKKEEEKETTKVFDNFNLEIEPRTKVGIVGYSGAGKSTLVNLLLRFFDIEEGNGSIEIDGYDIRDITQRSLRNNISYIPQDVTLFHRSIRENIIYGKPNATEEELIEASKKACCHKFIMQLKDNYNALVGERGTKLSGGQRQRIAIARAILKNSPILILDEATSALDSVTETEVQTALKNLMKDKTVIAVAHRLSTLNNMDRIVVLDKGKIIEDGTQRELLQIKDGLFLRMWNMQQNGIMGQCENENTY